MAATGTDGHFLPFRKRDLMHFCADDPALGEKHARADFLAAAKLIEAIYHHRFHEHLEALKTRYAAFDPDRDTIDIHALEPDPAGFKARLRELLVKANFQEITREQLEQALHRDSLLKIRLQVNFDEFDDALLFYRGETERDETLRSWFGLRRKNIKVAAYDRVLIYIRPKDATNAVVLKLFKNVPRADLEMLFPNTTAHMKPIDKLMIAVPAAVSAGIVLFTKLGATLLLVAGFISFWLGLSDREVRIDQASLIALGAGMASLGAVLWREFNKFKNRKLAFMKALTENLYYKNLDNNQGVLARLIDAAEEEECKEAMVAYFQLLRADTALDAATLDREVERWFAQELDCTLDFEVSDALNKLRELGIVEQHDDRYRALPPADAVRVMDVWWDNLFSAA